MIKCPKCGSSAQIRLIDHESQFFENNNKFYIKFNKKLFDYGLDSNERKAMKQEDYDYWNFDEEEVEEDDYYADDDDVETSLDRKTSSENFFGDDDDDEE